MKTFHQCIAQILSALDVTPFGFLWGPDCGGNKRNQMFQDVVAHREGSHTQPDGVLADVASVPLIVEIEEEAGEYGFDPNRICGKWASAALCGM